jgi:heme-binding protein
MTAGSRRFLPAAALFGVAAALQLVPSPRPGNLVSAGDRSIQASLDVPSGVHAVLQKACRNCHSNQTRWPWYSYVAPVSWIVARDVQRARSAVNFSQWATQPGPNPGAAAGTLSAACAGLRIGRMPPAPYRLMYPEARLTAGEIDLFCSWTAAENRLLRASRKVGQMSE